MTEPHALEAMMRLEVGEPHLNLLALVARLIELRSARRCAGEIAVDGWVIGVWIEGMRHTNFPSGVVQSPRVGETARACARYSDKLRPGRSAYQMARINPKILWRLRHKPL